MSHIINQEVLEYWFAVGVDRGLTEDEAIAFAEDIVENEGYPPQLMYR